MKELNINQSEGLKSFLELFNIEKERGESLLLTADEALRKLQTDKLAAAIPTFDGIEVIKEYLKLPATEEERALCMILAGSYLEEMRQLTILRRGAGLTSEASVS